mgnify:CR=1 FL=1
MVSSIIYKMRLYLETLPGKINKDNLEQYKRNTLTENLILSNEGIFKITNNNILKKNINDGTFRNYNIANNNFILDNSHYSYDKFYKIPFDHSNVKKTIDIFSLNEKSKSKLVIEYIKNNISDIYFDIHDTPNSPLIISDITTLVSLLN